MSVSQRRITSLVTESAVESLKKKKKDSSELKAVRSKLLSFTVISFGFLVYPTELRKPLHFPEGEN